MVLRMPDEEDVPCGLGLVVVQPGRQLFFSGLQVPLPQVDQGQWFSPDAEIRDGVSCAPAHKSPPVFLTEGLPGLVRHRGGASAPLLLAPGPPWAAGCEQNRQAKLLCCPRPCEETDSHSKGTRDAERRKECLWEGRWEMPTGWPH